MAERRQLISVGELNLRARRVLEQGVGEQWVSGELSRVTRHGSGHWYFTLKDAEAAVSCAMFARENAGVAFEPADGMQVEVRGRASLYEASGRYQLIISEMEAAGRGALQQQFEALKAKLAEQDGLLGKASTAQGKDGEEEAEQVPHCGTDGGNAVLFFVLFTTCLG